METIFHETAETARRLARSDDSQTSKDAAVKMVESGALNKQEKEVYKAIVEYDDANSLSKVFKNQGFTTKDIAESMSEFRRYADYYKWYDICRKRFSGLADKGKIEPTGDRRDGCQIWRLK